MPIDIADLLRKYEEGKRIQELGVGYLGRERLADTQADLAEGRLEQQPLETAGLETRNRQAAFNLDESTRESERRGQEFLQRGADRDLVNRGRELGIETAEANLANLPSPEDVAAERDARLGVLDAQAAAARGRGEYYSAGGRPVSDRFTGRAVDEVDIRAARLEAANRLLGPQDLYMNEEDGKVYKKRAYMPDKEVGDLPPEMMAQIHMETISRLRAAGYSDPAIAKAGLSLGQSPVDKVTAGTDENDPLNLGLNAPGQGSPNDPLGLFDE